MFVFKEREKETKRIKLQKKTEEAEQKRLATEFEERKHQCILREIEEREREAQALLNDVGKHIKKKGKKPIIEGVSYFYSQFHVFTRLEALARVDNCFSFIG